MVYSYCTSTNTTWLLAREDVVDSIGLAVVSISKHQTYEDRAVLSMSFLIKPTRFAFIEVISLATFSFCGMLASFKVFFFLPWTSLNPNPLGRLGYRLPDCRRSSAAQGQFLECKLARCI